MGCLNCNLDTKDNLIEIKVSLCNKCVKDLERILLNPFKIGQYILLLKNSQSVNGMKVTLNGKDLNDNGVNIRGASFPCECLD